MGLGGFGLVFLLLKPLGVGDGHVLTFWLPLHSELHLEPGAFGQVPTLRMLRPPERTTEASIVTNKLRSHVSDIDVVLRSSILPENDKGIYFGLCLSI